MALALFAATQLPLVIVITDIGVSNGWLTSATAAVLSVLVFPSIAVRTATPVSFHARA